MTLVIHPIYQNKLALIFSRIKVITLSFTNLLVHNYIAVSLLALGSRSITASINTQYPNSSSSWQKTWEVVRGGLLLSHDDGG